MLKVYLPIFMIVLFAVPSFADEEIVAKVNGTVFTRNDLESEVDRLIQMTTFHRTVPPEKRKNYYERALTELIDRELQFRDAKANNTVIEKEKIDANLEKFKKRFSSEKDFQAALEKEKTTEAEVRMRIEREMLAQAAFTRNVTQPARISDSALKEYYDTNSAKFKEPDSVRLRIISVRDERKAKDILAKIKNGSDFSELAYNFSEDSYRTRGGDAGFIHKGRMLPEIDEAAFKLNVGEVSDIINAETNYYIIKLEEKRPQHQVAFEEIKDKLRKELEAERANELKKQWMDRLRSKATIEVLLKTQ